MLKKKLLVVSLCFVMSFTSCGLIDKFTGKESTSTEAEPTQSANAGKAWKPQENESGSGTEPNGSGTEPSTDKVIQEPTDVPPTPLPKIRIVVTIPPTFTPTPVATDTPTPTPTPIPTDTPTPAPTNTPAPATSTTEPTRSPDQKIPTKAPKPTATPIGEHVHRWEALMGELVTPEHDEMQPDGTVKHVPEKVEEVQLGNRCGICGYIEIFEEYAWMEIDFGGYAN